METKEGWTFSPYNDLILFRINARFHGIDLSKPNGEIHVRLEIVRFLTQAKTSRLLT